MKLTVGTRGSVLALAQTNRVLKQIKQAHPDVEFKLNIIKTASVATAFGILTRVLIMLPFDYFVYGFLVSLVSGLSVSVSYAIVLASMPWIIIYNITVPIIMIPISYSIAKSVSKYRLLKSDSNIC